MKKMEKKKCFVIYRKWGKEIATSIFTVAKEKKIGLECSVIFEDNFSQFTKIPEKYDLYFIHLNDLTDEELGRLGQLQRDQPESYFVKLGADRGGFFKGEKRLSSRDQLVYEEEIGYVLSEFVKCVK